MKNMLKFFSIEKGMEESSAGKRLKSSQEGVMVKTNPPYISNYREGKKYLHISSKRGKVLHPCASMYPEYICCNVQVLDTVSNCTSDCSYCFLQNYLNDGRVKVVGDTKSVMEEVRERVNSEPWRFFRIGTWELGDSLVLEPVTGTASELIKEFATLKNALLELKTKSGNVEELLNIDHGGRTVAAWSLNPQEIIKREEHRTADLESRLKAMEKAAGAGYLLAIHFDPMITYEGWERGYEELVNQVFQAVQAEQIAWISIGSLRFNPEMKKVIEANFPGSRITSSEMVLGQDGKVRYVKPLRLDLYHLIYKAIRKYGSKNNLVYLCMERWDVWKRVFGYYPRSIGHLDYLFAESLYRRFPGLVHQAPDLSLYDPQSNEILS